MGILPSQFVETFIKVDGKDFKGECGFDAWPYLKAVYDDPSQFRIMKCSRQVAKSTTLGNLILIYSAAIPGFRSLYVAPRNEQMQTFSFDRLSTVIRQSPLLSKLTSHTLTNKVTEKSFINSSVVRLRSAYLRPDRVRGIPSRMIAIDEFQDFQVEHIPVILECAATFPSNKIVIYSGTPLTLDNAIQFYWERYSTMCEWMTKCPFCGYWNGVKLENLGVDGYICSKCTNSLEVRSGQWVKGRKKAQYSGFHINQIMSPFVQKDWKAITQKYETYKQAEFMNEVMGESFDSGVRPITREQLISCCKNHVIDENHHPEYNDKMMVAGCDWGTGVDSFTFLVIAQIIDDKFKIVYFKKYKGMDAEQDKMLAHMTNMMIRYSVKKIGADHGLGYYYNHRLAKEFGPEKVIPMYYSDGAKRKMKWDKNNYMATINKTSVLEDVFQLLKKKDVMLPKEESCEELLEDILAEFIEEDHKVSRLRYRRTAERPDDGLHALTYAILAAQFIKPRYDLFNPQLAAEEFFSD